MATSAPEGVRQAAWDAAARSASLGVGHVWTAVLCLAYQTYEPRDCTCNPMVRMVAAIDHAVSAAARRTYGSN